MLQRLFGGQQRTAYRPHGALRQLRAPGQAEAAQLVATHRAAAVALYVVALVRQRQNVMRSEEHTSELQSLMRISYAVFCLQKHKAKQINSCQYITLSNI